MAADATLSVEVIAKIANYTKQMEDAANKTKESTQKMQSEFEKLSDAVKTVTKISGYLASVYAVGSFFGKAIKEANDYNLEINKLSQSMDISLAKASALKEALGDLGIDTDVVRMAQQRLKLAMIENADAFTVLRVNTRNTDGSLRSTFDVMMDVIDATKQLGRETDRSAVLSKIFGRSSEETKQLLRLTRDEIRSATDETELYGRVVDQEAIAKTRAWNRTVGDIGDVYTDAKRKLADFAKQVIFFLDPMTSKMYTANLQTELNKIADAAKNAADGQRILTREELDLLAGTKKIIDEAPKLKDVFDSITLQELPTDKLQWIGDEFTSIAQMDMSWLGSATENLTIFNEKYAEFQLNNEQMILSLQTSIETTTQIFAALTSGFSSAITGMITGTMSFSEGFKTIMRSAITSVIQLLVNMALQRALGAILEKKVIALKALTEVGAAASVAGANAYAFNAWNPALASAAAAAAYAKTMAFAGTIPAFEKGGNVANDSLALLHKNEMVLPAPLAESIRNMSGNGVQNVTYNINAMDASSFDSYLKQNASSVFAANKLAIRNGSQFA